MPYYISQPKATYLKKSFCVEPLPNEIQQTLNATECLTVYDYDTAKAITCFLRNIDRHDGPQDLIRNLQDIVAHLGRPGNILMPRYIIPYQMGLPSKPKTMIPI